MLNAMAYNNDMDRRTFIKSAAALTIAPAAISVSAHSQPTDGLSSIRWPYIVYCYERGQGEWTFSENTRGSFNYQNEYKTFDDSPTEGYCGFHKPVDCGYMYDGKLHFHDIERATDFIEMHVRVKDDINVIDSIYDVYYENDEGTQIHVAHYWYNGDSGSQIHWVADQPYMNWSKVECA